MFFLSSIMKQPTGYFCTRLKLQFRYPGNAPKLGPDKSRLTLECCEEVQSSIWQWGMTGLHWTVFYSNWTKVQKHLCALDCMCKNTASAITLQVQ